MRIVGNGQISNSSEKGITLIEALVSTAIVAIGFIDQKCNDRNTE